MRRTLVLACAVAAVAALVHATPVGAQTASELRGQLGTAGRRLDQASESYNKARLERQHLDVKLSSAQQELARSEKKLAAVRGRLGKAVKYMYKHPAGGMDTFYQARSFGE